MTTELDDLRERQRLAEAKIEALTAERAELERAELRVGIGPLHVLALVAVTLAVGVGAYMTGDRQVSVARALDRAAAYAEYERAAAADDARIAACQKDLMDRRNALADCRVRCDRERAKPVRTPCRCEPGDPLCSCL